jgi:hypothetical protein
MLANTPGMTVTALTVWSRTTHPTMPNLAIEPTDMGQPHRLHPEFARPVARLIVGGRPCPTAAKATLRAHFVFS